MCVAVDYRYLFNEQIKITEDKRAVIVTLENVISERNETIRQQAEQIEALREALEHTCWAIENGDFPPRSIGSNIAEAGRAVLDQTKGQ